MPIPAPPITKPGISVVQVEVALTAFFGHWWIEDEAELDAWYEREMPGPATQPLFEEAARLGIGFYLGYAELAFEGGVKHRYNSSVLVGPDGSVIGKNMQEGDGVVGELAGVRVQRDERGARQPFR